MPADSVHIDEEGLISAGLKVIAAGCFQEQALRGWLMSGPDAARNPEQNIADLQAQIAANQCGANALQDLVARYGLPVIQAYMEFVLQQAEISVRQLLVHLPD